MKKHVGQGVNGSLKILHEKDEDMRITKSYTKRKDIKEETIKHDTKHFSMAIETKMYRDKIYAKLDDKVIRKKILEGKLKREDCDDKDAFEFLPLLKRPEKAGGIEFRPMEKDDWTKVVKKASKRSASSFFSKRNYAMYKMTLTNERMTNLLIKFYNMIIAVQFFPNRWLKTLVVMIEKGKGPVLGKLRTIQLIEADLQLLMRIFINDQNKGSIETDERISKSNYGSRPGYSIQDAILEKG